MACADTLHSPLICFDTKIVASCPCPWSFCDLLQKGEKLQNREIWDIGMVQLMDECKQQMQLGFSWFVWGPIAARLIGLEENRFWPKPHYGSGWEKSHGLSPQLWHTLMHTHHTIGMQWNDTKNWVQKCVIWKFAMWHEWITWNARYKVVNLSFGLN